MMAKQKKNTQPESILDKLQNDWKTVVVVVLLCIFINLDFVNGLFKMNGITYFIMEDGSLNMQAVILKATVAGSVFFGLKQLLDSQA